MTYIFESGLAHHIEGLIQQKRADGYAYNSEEKRFNSFSEDFSILQNLLKFEGPGIELIVFPFLGNQVIMRPAFDDMSLFQNHDNI